MATDVIAVFIPIIFILVVGLILITFFYFRSREKQMLIEKGLDAQSIKEFFQNKRDPYTLLKIGVIIVGFGLGLGLGLILQDIADKDYWIPFMLFIFTGAGFIVANRYSVKQYEKLENKNASI
jgi:hypothetical protein